MKAQRRHELKQNTLARGLEQLPEASRQHGTKILVAVLLVLLAVFFIRQRIAGSRESAVRAAHSLDTARALIGQLDEAVQMGMAQSPQAMASVRQRVYGGATDAIQMVLDAADDPRLLAEARVARGDLNWKLANFPDIPGAATQPVLQFSRSRQDLLNTAADAYRNVVEDPAAPPESLRTARLGLAAVYENRREWDNARAEYQKIVNDTSVPKPFKDLAADRLNDLDKVQRPPLVGAPPTAQNTLPTTAAATQASATAPATKTTAPSSPSPASAQPPAAQPSLPPVEAPTSKQ